MASAIISSQSYRDDDTVAAKRAAGDYTVTVWPVTVMGQEYRVVVDGHHSLAAAIADGVDPELVAPAPAIASEYQYEIDSQGVESWLESHWIDSDYYDVSTGLLVWQ